MKPKHNYNIYAFIISFITARYLLGESFIVALALSIMFVIGYASLKKDKEKTLKLLND